MVGTIDTVVDDHDHDVMVGGETGAVKCRTGTGRQVAAMDPEHDGLTAVAVGWSVDIQIQAVLALGGDLRGSLVRLF